MKKLIYSAFATLITIYVLTGCTNNSTATNSNSVENTSEDNQSATSISVVTTIFPEYDWVKEISKGADNVELTMLLDNGVDLHSYQPTADDIAKVASCDLFIYVGGESDEWVEDALNEATNKNMKVIDLLDVLGDSVKEEEVKEGMEAEEEEEEGDSDEEETEYDEHVWLSLKNAKVLSQAISDSLCQIDADNASLYQTNTEAYISSLDSLDKEYEESIAGAFAQTLLFGDRFPFRYLVDDYNLDYYAAFVGCSAESEASFETILFLADKVDSLSLSSILQIETSDGKIAETIKDNTKTKDQEILTLDSMQSTTLKDTKDGASYLSIMEKNLEVLKTALG